jgi:hypothetical protein
MNEFLAILKDQVQLAALAFMAVVYVSKVIWLMRFKPIVERTPSRGSKSAGIAYSYMTIAMPWAMESYRRQWYKYVEFSLFHLGVLVAIAASFIIPYAPEVMNNGTVVILFQTIVAAAFVVGVVRLVRRVFSPAMRIVSSIDDYFSIILLDVWLLSSFFAMPNESYWMLVAFFALTAFFLVYVPFSKISHYLLWPFTRYHLGKHLGHRGVYPKKQGIGFRRRVSEVER